MFDELFQRGGLSLDRLRSFLAVAEAGAIARAAPGDPVRQSQLSRQIGELEEFFGQALVERRGRGLAVTAAGARLAVTVREAFLGLREFAATPADQPFAASLGAGDSLLHAWVIPRLPRTLPASLTLAAMHGPEVVARLLDARLDFGIARMTEVPASLRTRPLGTITFALYVPRALRRKRRTGSVAELVASLPIAAQYGDPEIAEALAAALRDASASRGAAPITPALVCETFPQAQRAVMTERFAAVLPTLARRDLPASTFDEVELLATPSRKVVFAWHRRIERQRPRVAALIGELVAAFALR